MADPRKALSLKLRGHQLYKIRKHQSLSRHTMRSTWMKRMTILTLKTRAAKVHRNSHLLKRHPRVLRWLRPPLRHRDMLAELSPSTIIRTLSKSLHTVYCIRNTTNQSTLPSLADRMSLYRGTWPNKVLWRNPNCLKARCSSFRSISNNQLWSTNGNLTFECGWYLLTS